MTKTAILTADEIRAAEQALFATGVPEYDVMERAGAAAADIIWRVGGARDVLILCGPGNNGGDGFVIARLLQERGVPVRVAALGESRTSSARQARAMWNGPVEDIFLAPPATQVVDALFGTGLTRGLDERLADRLICLVQNARLSYAIDLPSGVGTDDGDLLSDVPQYDICIAFTALKPAHVLYPAAAKFRRLICADIGISTAAVKVRLLKQPKLASPSPEAHKYTRGLVAVLGGAMPGAAALAANAAAHGGAGYVRLISRSTIFRLPHAIVQENVGVAEAFADRRISASLLGPGLGRQAKDIAQFSEALAAGHPAVIDADGLLALKSPGFEALPEKTILTPHQGEFHSLFSGLSGSSIVQAQVAAVVSGAVVVLKGVCTIVAAPDGRTAVSSRASSWLSTAGTGDVLSGICAARLAVTGDPFRSACEAVWLHGEAARLAGAAFIADDLIAHLPAAIGSCL